MLQQRYFISAGDANAEGELSLPQLISRIIDIATLHANSLGVGNPSMEHLGLGWVLSRLTVEMQSYPTVNSEFILSTWVEQWNRHFSVRDFRIDDSEGRPLGHARSIWMVMNTLKRENAGLAHLSLPPEAIEPGVPCPIERQKKHLHIPAEFLDREYTFKYTDLDFYRHVNTVRYVDLLLNGYSLEEMDRNMVRRLELSFLHECHCGATVEIRSRATPTPGTTVLMLFETRQDREILFSRISLAPRVTASSGQSPMGNADASKCHSIVES